MSAQGTPPEVSVTAAAAPVPTISHEDTDERRESSARAQNALGFDPFHSDDEGSENQDSDGELDTERLEAFLGERFLNMDLKAIEAELKAAQAENDEVDLETRVLSTWKEEHVDDFVTMFGTADPTAILKLRASKDMGGDSDRRSMTSRRKTQRTIKNKTVGSSMGFSTRTPATLLLTVDQKAAILHHHDATQHKELITRREAINEVLDEYIAAIDECNETSEQLTKKRKQIEAAFHPRRLEKVAGSMRPTLAYLQNRNAEMLTWLDNEIQHCRLNTEMSTNRLQKVKLQLTRLAMEDSSRELSPLDYERLQITVEKVEAALKGINEKYFDLKANEGRVEKAHARFVIVMAETEATLAQLKKEIKTRNKMLSHLTKEKNTLRETIDLEKEKKQAFEEKLKRWEAPPVLDYIRDKQHVHLASKDLQNLTRRVEIAETQLRQVKSVWKSITDQSMLQTQEISDFA
eukprot:m.30455 g.30455  ORF g.30455 m.30455 type:complete len:463 (+) comp4711_c0_seq1:201-1589(+)